jgi:hypothetical protein
MSINNILAVYQEATESEVQEGIAWYKDARSFCRTTAKEYGVSLEVVVAVVSALSPRNKWKTNLKDTITVLEAVRNGLGPDDVQVATFHKNKYKAFRIIQESKPSLVKKSNKTSSFFDNIKFENSLVITVDTHAFSVYNGEVTTAKSITNKVYQQISDDYRLVALEVGLKGYQLQACCWVVWQRLRKTKKAKQKILTSV